MFNVLRPYRVGILHTFYKKCEEVCNGETTRAERSHLDQISASESSPEARRSSARRSVATAVGASINYHKELRGLNPYSHKVSSNSKFSGPPFLCVSPKAKSAGRYRLGEYCAEISQPNGGTNRGGLGQTALPAGASQYDLLPSTNYHLRFDVYVLHGNKQ